MIERDAGADIVDVVVELFEGDRKAAGRWYGTPAPGLGGTTPREAYRQGRYEDVRRLVARLEHGTFM